MNHRILAVTLPFVLAACSSNGSSGGATPDGSTGAGGSGAGGGSTAGSGGAPLGGGGAAGSAGSGIVGATGGSTSGGAGGGMPDIPPIVYAHTDTTLSTLDPTAATLDLTTVGDFDCVPSQTTAMTDIAVNAAGELWGVSAHAVWKLEIQGAKVACTKKIPLADANVRFYALTFVPAGILGDAEELIAGNTAGELWFVNRLTGATVQHGTFGAVPANDGNGHAFANAGKPWELAGDLVFLANNGKPVGFATVRDCPSPPDTASCNAANTLIEIDVPKLGTATTESVTKAVRGQIVTGASCTDGKNGYYGNMYGIATWGDQLYGFSRSGDLVRVSLNDGSGCLVKSYPAQLFAGAGVSTLAPIVVPMPK